MLIAETEAVQSAEGEFYQNGLYSFEFITGMQDSVGCVCVCERERERERECASGRYQNGKDASPLTTSSNLFLRNTCSMWRKGNIPTLFVGM